MSNDVLTLTDETFDEEVLLEKRPVLVDFGAKWCSPCRQVDPIVEELAQKYAGQVKFGKLDIEENQEVAARYRVQSLPTLLLFKQGQVVQQQVGALSRARLERLLDEAL